MSDIFEADKIILKKEVFLSVLSWSVLCYIILMIIGRIGLFMLNLGTKSPSLDLMLSALGVGLLFFTLIPIAVWAILLYIALKKNWKRFGLITYRFKLTYLAYIFIFVIGFDIIINFIITRQFRLPQFGLLSLIVLFIIPTRVETKQRK